MLVAYTFGLNQKTYTTMATVTERPFPCGDGTFIDSVLEDHKKSSAAHDVMVAAHSGEANPEPLVYTYSQHTIPTDCNAYYVKITFDPASTSNADINIAFIDWPEDDGNPVSVSGEVYYSLVLFNGVRNRKLATYLEMRKGIEITDDGNYVTVVFKAFKADGTNVYNGNVTSMHPAH
jgi:hypothetical protein